MTRARNELRDASSGASGCLKGWLGRGQNDAVQCLPSQPLGTSLPGAGWGRGGRLRRVGAFASARPFGRLWGWRRPRLCPGGHGPGPLQCVDSRRSCAVQYLGGPGRWIFPFGSASRCPMAWGRCPAPGRVSGKPAEGAARLPLHAGLAGNRGRERFPLEIAPALTAWEARVCWEKRKVEFYADLGPHGSHPRGSQSGSRSVWGEGRAALDTGVCCQVCAG